MAYAESTLGGSTGGSYRVWVNSIRTYDGNQSENFEDWRCEGGLNKISTGVSAYNNYNAANYTLQLGINGVAQSGNFNYNFASGTTGRVLAWGSATTRAYRNSAGVGFGFTSRMDINMSNSPLLTSGWVTSSDGVQTKLRHAVLTALSMDAGGIPAYDEGPMWVEDSNPSGTAVDAFIDGPTGRAYTSAPGIGGHFDIPFGSGLPATLQAMSPNSNTFDINIGIHDSLGGDNYDYRSRTVTIKNDTGQANPTFANYTFADTRSATTTITGNNQVLIQGESTLAATVSVANKATPNKSATMSNYLFTLGGYSQSAAYSSGSNVVQTIGAVSDVTGSQNLSVRAVDSRGNNTTVTKPITILPYQSPGFFLATNVKYTNEFDSTGGITVEGYDNNLALVSPLTLSGTDLNLVNTTSGVKFDIRRSDGSFSGTYTNIAITQAAGTGLISVNLATLGTSILTRMNAIGADNTKTWFVKFQLTDKLYVNTYTVTIDVGRPILRIGADSNLYYKEIDFHEEFNPQNTFLVQGILASGIVGTWSYAGLTGFSFGAGALTNSGSAANGDYCIFAVFLNAGTFSLTTSFVAATNRGISRLIIAGYDFGGGSVQYDKDNYSASTTENIYTLTGIVITTPGWYTFAYMLNGKNASSSAYIQSVIGLRFFKSA